MVEGQENTEVAVVPRIDDLRPAAAMPGGIVELTGAGLGPESEGPPKIFVDGLAADVLMSREGRLVCKTPDTASTGLVAVHGAGGESNAVPLRVAHQLADELHPVTNPAVSSTGTIYATISGQRGKQTPTSIVRIRPGEPSTPFVSGILNATGLAFSPDDELYATSRADGTVYRIGEDGSHSAYVEGMGVATGAVFDAEGNLFVGDRSGTIFKINTQKQIFVHATLEASPAAYHLAVNGAGTLFVSAPMQSSNETIWAVEPNGDVRVWYRGLGRPQGLALAQDGSVYVAACLHGQRGLVRVSPRSEAELVLAGASLVGVAFSPMGATILTTQDAVYEVDLGVEGLHLF
jgi:sugar lactone lactonase YvrE